MDLVKKIKSIFTNACIFFTVSEFVLLAIAAGFSQLAPESGGGLSAFLKLGPTALIFLACFIMSALNLIFELELSGSIKLVLHFIGSLTAYSVVFIVIPGAWRSLGAMLARLFAFAVLYLVIAVTVSAVRGAKARKISDESEYESQFGEFFSGRKK